MAALGEDARARGRAGGRRRRQGGRAARPAAGLAAAQARAGRAGAAGRRAPGAAGARRAAGAPGRPGAAQIAPGALARGGRAGCAAAAPRPGCAAPPTARVQQPRACKQLLRECDCPAAGGRARLRQWPGGAARGGQGGAAGAGPCRLGPAVALHLALQFGRRRARQPSDASLWMLAQHLLQPVDARTAVAAAR